MCQSCFAIWRTPKGTSIMKCTREPDGSLKVVGTLDEVTAPEFEKFAGEFLSDENARGASQLLLDLSDLLLINTEGVRVIVNLSKKTRLQGMTFRIVGLRDQPRAIFRLMRLDRVFPI